jgi:hypothetical protein
MPAEQTLADAPVRILGVKRAGVLGIRGKVMNRFGIVERLCRLRAGVSLEYVGLGGKQKRVVQFLAASCGAFLMASCAIAPLAPEGPPFSRQANADLIIRYYSPQVSHLLKPLTMEGPFYVACERPAVLSLAAQQPRRELAVVVLISYFSTTEEDRVKTAWMGDLKHLGYHDVVFLRAGRGMQVDGLPILKGPQEPATIARH